MKRILSLILLFISINCFSQLPYYIPYIQSDRIVGLDSIHVNSIWYKNFIPAISSPSDNYIPYISNGNLISNTNLQLSSTNFGYWSNGTTIPSENRNFIAIQSNALTFRHYTSDLLEDYFYFYALNTNASLTYNTTIPGYRQGIEVNSNGYAQIYTYNQNSNNLTSFRTQNENAYIINDNINSIIINVDSSYFNNKLIVDDTIKTNYGIKFPDGTFQNTAATGGSAQEQKYTLLYEVEQSAFANEFNTSQTIATFTIDSTNLEEDDVIRGDFYINANDACIAIDSVKVFCNGQKIFSQTLNALATGSIRHYKLSIKIDSSFDFDCMLLAIDGVTKSLESQVDNKTINSSSGNYNFSITNTSGASGGTHKGYMQKFELLKY